MTINKKTLAELLESMRLIASKAQKTAILSRFDAEPTPYNWTEQDITVQIQNFLGCGEFVKTVSSDGERQSLPTDTDF